MLDIGWSEMVVILVVALIVIGPKDLPRVARNVGRWVAKGRALAREFQNSLEEMAREAELDKVKTEIEKAGRVDPKRMIENTIDPKGELGRAFDPTTGEEAKPRRGRAAGAGATTARPAADGAATAPVADEAEADRAAAEPAAGAGRDRAGGPDDRARRPEPVE